MLIWSRRPLHCLWMPFSWNIFFHPFNLRLSLFANKKHFLQATNNWVLFLNPVYKSVYFGRRLDWLTFRILICKIYYFLVYYCLCFLMFIFWHTSVACLLFMCSHEHFLFSWCMGHLKKYFLQCWLRNPQNFKFAFIAESFSFSCDYEGSLLWVPSSGLAVVFFQGLKTHGFTA